MQQPYKLLLCFFILLLASACSEPQLKPLTNHSVILAFGDSLTYGVGSHKGRSYPEILAELTGIKVVNAGISGETTTEGLKRFQSVIDQHLPDLIILMEGGNDILRNHSQQKIKKNLSKMINIATADSIPVILIGIPEKKLFSNSAPFYQELAEEYNLIFEQTLLSELLRQPKFKSDTVHLNSNGYYQFSERIYQLLKANGAIN